MTREIKFRVWSLLSGKGAMIYLDSGMLSDLDTIENQWYVEQYTGLKDKNGKEIYEGDIILNDNSFGCQTSWGDKTDNNPTKRLVIFDGEDPTFRLAYLEEDIRDRGTSGYCFTKSNSDSFEVIGNIHEGEEKT